MPGEPGTVLIVHAVDTEGPLYESLDATFDRLADIYGLTDLPRSRETLEQLQDGKLDLGGLEAEVAKTLNGHLLRYNDTWDKIEAMLERIMTRSFRMRYPDSFGRGWIFNWHCVDHVGYDYNPRRRDIGYHNIFDYYSETLRRWPESGDAIHFHFHPMSIFREAHRCATSYVNSPELHQILCRRIIERRWFPTVFRAGFQSERPDSHWFLEQWIPMDLSNMALEDSSPLGAMTDFRNGRSGDWRGAPSDWSVYRPSHDDYRALGSCRRWIGRALNVMNRIAPIDQAEMDRAFARADGGNPTLVGLASHDFRDLHTEVVHLTELIDVSSRRYPRVRFRYCEAVEAFRLACGMDVGSMEPVRLDLRLTRRPKDDVPNLEIRTRAGVDLSTTTSISRRAGTDGSTRSMGIRCPSTRSAGSAWGPPTPGGTASSRCWT
jgi:hypothetical protein